MDLNERNEEAALRMRKRIFILMQDPVDMKKGDVCDYTKAVMLLSQAVEVDKGELQSFTLFLLGRVDYSNPGEEPNLMSRFACISKCTGGLENAVRDWNNRFEMGN